jgi:GntR family transcriptional repressor for pyruvate dehydrogenase complex
LFRHHLASALSAHAANHPEAEGDHMKSTAQAMNLTRSVIETFKEQFLSGRIKPGDRIPSERELTEQLNVSRTTIREAIIALKVMGLVDVQRGKRARVKVPSVDNVLEILSLVAPLDQMNILNLLELREIFEPACVFLAVKRVTASELSTIQQKLDYMKRSHDDLDAFFKADYEFHKAIMIATHNNMIVMFYNIFQPLLKSLHQRIVMTSQETDDHEKVLQAMMKGNNELAYDLARKIIISARDRLYKAISEEEQEIAESSLPDASDAASRHG